MPEHFDTVQVADGVHAAVAGRSGAAVGNAAIIDAGGKTIVVDTFMTAQAAAELADEAVRLTGRSAALVVNTHWHGDHTNGNQVFAGTPMAATERTVQLMVAAAPADLTAYEAEIDGYLATFRAMLEDEDQERRRLARRRIAGLDQLKRAVPGFRLTLPDVIVADRLDLSGERAVEAVTDGGGHTDSDVYVWLPDDRVLVAGDLCWNRIHPRIHDGHPAAWRAILERLAGIGAETVVPGHGRPGTAAMIDALIPYLAEVAGLVEEVRSGAEAGRVAVPSGSEAWEGPERLRDGLAAVAAR